MSTDLENAKKALEAGGFTCVLCKGPQQYESTRRGVAPLLAWLDSGLDFHGYSAADRVVGRGAAFLYCLLGVCQVYAPVMSRDGADILTCHGITPHWEVLTDTVLNHRKDGCCPMEIATRGIQNPAEALGAMRKALDAMG